LIAVPHEQSVERGDKDHVKGRALLRGDELQLFGELCRNPKPDDIAAMITYGGTLAAAIEAALAEPGRNICILGHAGQEGGATTSIQLAAQRARAVTYALAARGIAPDRLRSEARSAQFSPTVRAAEPPSRTVTIVLMPAP
jgi:hypothetical protein